MDGKVALIWDDHEIQNTKQVVNSTSMIISGSGNYMIASLSPMVLQVFSSIASCCCCQDADHDGRISMNEFVELLGERVPIQQDAGPRGGWAVGTGTPRRFWGVPWVDFKRFADDFRV